MPDGLLPLAAPDGETLTDPQAVVEAFLAALAAADVDQASELVAEDIVYVNVGLPAMIGRHAVDKFLRSLARPGVGFEVYMHAVSAEGPVVLTERTDVLIVGRLRVQFWVCGRFDVHDGRITLWRDAFDYLDILRGTVRGLAALFMPSLQAKAPVGSDVAPGRMR